ncbi:MAG: cob(I)yrinic acid a,c-diamide adenosyltransferase [Pseudomonadota bacterium]|nr:cob(I)yrinic acid a,c-diamide adenosyltransferase [Pseudomonadota bacterium]
MVKLDKIYTRGGDTGLTSLGNGERVKKDSLRVKSYGEVDEINSIIGVVVCYCSNKLKKTLRKIQNELFDIGAILCMPGKKKNAKLINEAIVFLEKDIDKMNSKLSNLKSFILPGGSKSSSFLHLARTITRRCERTLVQLNSKEKMNPEIIQYINRLSDFLFVAARIENIKDGDILWVPNKK